MTDGEFVRRMTLLKDRLDPDFDEYAITQEYGGHDTFSGIFLIGHIRRVIERTNRNDLSPNSIAGTMKWANQLWLQLPPYIDHI